MFKFKIFLIILPLLINFSIISQIDTAFILPQLKIFQRENNKKVTYNFEEFKYNRFIVKDNFLIADTHRYKYKVDINDIRQVSFRDGNNGWILAAYGAGFGFILGFWAGAYFTFDGPAHFNIKTAIPGGLIIALPFGLIGGLVGMLTPAYDDYDMRKVPIDYKPALLKKIFKKNKVKTF